RERVRPLGLSALIGRRRPIRAFEIVPEDGTQASLGKLLARDALTEGLAEFEARRFAEAGLKFRQAAEICPEDAVAGLYLRNAARLMADPPPEDWTGAAADPRDLR
ncbi:MAG: hypothetical protein AAF192_19125, partial [Pseudomonadota bacterium]